MREIYLHGHLKDKFGAVHRLDVKSPAEAIKALSILHKGFRQELTQGEYHLIRGDEDEGFEIPLDAIHMRLGDPPLHIIPHISGSGRGAGKAILGVALIAGAFLGAPAVVGALGPTQGLGATAFGLAGFSVSWANIATFGLNLALTGIASALSPQPKAQNLAAINAEERPSWLFNGAVQNIEQGGIVPVWYGEVEVGSTVISGGLEVYQI